MHARIINALSLALLIWAGIVTVSCTSSPPSARQKLFSSSASDVNTAANDYTKPYLTDEKVKKFIDSMKEGHNPFEAIFKDGGQMLNPVDLANKMEEFNAFAHKYGFKDYEDYSTVWGRIVVGETQLWGEGMVNDSVQEFRKTISNAQAQLKKPDLSPEERKMYEEQIKSSQETIDNMSKSDSQSALNAADLALVKKYKDQIDQAERKYKAAK